MFDFSYFPEERELLPDVERALQFQCKSGVVDVIRESILNACRTLKHYNELDWEIDFEGLELISGIAEGSLTIHDMDEEQREVLAVLWVNYMCDKHRGEIVNSLGMMLRNKQDYRASSMNIIRENLQEDLHDESTRMGAVLYLWTLICVTRALENAVAQNREELAVPPSFNGISLN